MYLYPFLLLPFPASSGIQKAKHPYAFLIAIYGYQILTPTYAHAAVILIPSIEITCAAALFLRCGERGALLLTSILLVLFASAQLYVMARGLEADCGCFGGAGDLVGARTGGSHPCAARRCGLAPQIRQAA
jgi:hypothetical protein